MEETNNKILIVAGPTASGKSSLAIKIAQELGGEIVNADSVQLYRGMDIGSAKIMPSELQGIQQHLVDIATPDCPIDAAEFSRLADNVIKNIISSKNIPIIVGGSNLYLKALLYGLADLPKANVNLRAELELLSGKELHLKLTILDSKRAKELHSNDRFRLIRAIESCIDEPNNNAVSKKQSEHQFNSPRYDALILCLLPNRKELYGKINNRTALMLKSGLIQEVQTLVDTYGPNIRPLKALGYSQVLDFLTKQTGGEVVAHSPSELEQQIAQKTRNYAKQQLTFWRNEPLKRSWKLTKTCTLADLEFSELDLTLSSGSKNNSIQIWQVNN